MPVYARGVPIENVDNSIQCIGNETCTEKNLLRPIAMIMSSMEFLLTSPTFPYSGAVIHSGRTLETVLVSIPPGESRPVAGGAGAEMREIFRQLDEVLQLSGIQKNSIVSCRLYLSDVLRDIAEVNQVYAAYFGSHPPNRRAYGVVLQAGLLVEAAFVAEVSA